MQEEFVADRVGDALIERLIPGDRPHTYCEHLPSGPQSFYASSASPGAFFCGECFRSDFSTSRLRAHDESQTRCDACLAELGRQAALHPVHITAGSANLIASICDDCLRAASQQPARLPGGAGFRRDEGSPLLIRAPRLDAIDQ